MYYSHKNSITTMITNTTSRILCPCLFTAIKVVGTGKVAMCPALLGLERWKGTLRGCWWLQRHECRSWLRLQKHSLGAGGGTVSTTGATMCHLRSPTLATIQSSNGNMQSLPSLPQMAQMVMENGMAHWHIAVHAALTPSLL